MNKLYDIPGNNYINPYFDILKTERHITSRAHMTNYNRAAQFAPFAALSGYGEAINETARLTDRKIELDEDEKEKLDRKLSELVAVLHNRPAVRVTYFIPDPWKDGGKYVTVDRLLKKIDNINRKMIFTDGTEIEADNVFSIEKAPLNNESDG